MGILSPFLAIIGPCLSIIGPFLFIIGPCLFIIGPCLSIIDSFLDVPIGYKLCIHWVYGVRRDRAARPGITLSGYRLHSTYNT